MVLHRAPITVPSPHTTIQSPRTGFLDCTRCLLRRHSRRTLEPQRSYTSDRAAHRHRRPPPKAGATRSQLRLTHETQRTHHPRARARCAHHHPLHRGQRLPRPQGRTDLRVIHPRRGHLHGRPERRQRFYHSRKQHRSNRRLRGRHPLRHHLRPPRPRHRRLVDRIPLLGILPHLPERRRVRRPLHHPAA